MPASSDKSSDAAAKTLIIGPASLGQRNKLERACMSACPSFLAPWVQMGDPIETG